LSIIKLFGQDVLIKDYYCALDDNPPSKIFSPYINLYVQITNNCNAGCAFCCNQNKNNFIFDIDKFYKVIEEILKTVDIRKISFTGGEPTLYMPFLSKALHFVKEISPDTFTVINTNGSNLVKVGELSDVLNSVAVSRHHYNDEINEKIFGSSLVATSDDLKQFPHKEILHLSCNLMKDYIGNEEEIYKYLEFADSVGCDDVGFVTLMKINNYCEQQFINFADLNLKNDNMYVSKNWNNNGNCKCRNYLYVADSTNVIRVYSRYYVKQNNCESNLVFNGQYLRQGFIGKIII
jgi:MoaA/NifB/PqqE/SkfB family radical SAM enzyme